MLCRGIWVWEPVLKDPLREYLGHIGSQGALFRVMSLGI